LAFAETQQNLNTTDPLLERWSSNACRVRAVMTIKPLGERKRAITNEGNECLNRTFPPRMW